MAPETFRLGLVVGRHLDVAAMLGGRVDDVFGCVPDLFALFGFRVLGGALGIHFRLRLLGGGRLPGSLIGGPLLFGLLRRDGVLGRCGLHIGFDAFLCGLGFRVGLLTASLFGLGVGDRRNGVGLVTSR